MGFAPIVPTSLKELQGPREPTGIQTEVTEQETAPDEP